MISPEVFHIHVHKGAQNTTLLNLKDNLGDPAISAHVDLFHFL